jgi:hypothetical protein
MQSPSSLHYGTLFTTSNPFTLQVNQYAVPSSLYYGTLFATSNPFTLQVNHTSRTILADGLSRRTVMFCGSLPSIDITHSKDYPTN